MCVHIKSSCLTYVFISELSLLAKQYDPQSPFWRSTMFLSFTTWILNMCPGVCALSYFHTLPFYSKQWHTQHQPLMQYVCMYVCMLLLGRKQVQQLLSVFAKSLWIKYLQVFPSILQTHLHNITIRNIVTCSASMYEYAYNYIHTYYVVQHWSTYMYII